VDQCHSASESVTHVLIELICSSSSLHTCGTHLLSATVPVTVQSLSPSHWTYFALFLSISSVWFCRDCSLPLFSPSKEWKNHLNGRSLLLSQRFFWVHIFSSTGCLGNLLFRFLSFQFPISIIANKYFLCSVWANMSWICHWRISISRHILAVCKYLP